MEPLKCGAKIKIKIYETGTLRAKNGEFEMIEQIEQHLKVKPNTSLQQDLKKGMMRHE